MKYRYILLALIIGNILYHLLFESLNNWERVVERSYFQSWAITACYILRKGAK